MIITPTFVRNFRSLVQEVRPQSGAVYRFEGMGELWFSLDREVGDKLLEDGNTHHFTFLYSLTMDGVDYHFFSRSVSE